MNVPAIQLTANMELDKILHLVSGRQTQLGNITSQLVDKAHNINQAFDNFDLVLDDLKKQINDLIETSEKPWFHESFLLYEKELIHETAEYTLNRRPNITNETYEFYKTRIVRYTDWHYPAMIIRPGKEGFINDMVACDPLYLVDEKHELLEPAVSQQTEAYQQRLRTYVINERQDDEILDKLPNNQFGLVLAYNYFNFRPFEIIKKYLKEIYAKLKPGGHLLMTFNDCDREKGVLLVEQHFCCYTPGYLVFELAQSLGFETEFRWHNDGPSTWAEFKKPGTITSLRGGQALAKILPK
jgi:SAM-dependent methyltransferase